MSVKLSKLDSSSLYPYDIKAISEHDNALQQYPFMQQMQLNRDELYSLYYQIKEIMTNEDENNK